MIAKKENKLNKYKNIKNIFVEQKIGLDLTVVAKYQFTNNMYIIV